MTHRSVIHKRNNRVMEILTKGLPSPEKLLVLSGCFIAGGSLAYSEEPPQDYDVFFKTIEAYRLVIQNVARQNMQLRLRDLEGEVRDEEGLEGYAARDSAQISSCNKKIKNAVGKVNLFSSNATRLQVRFVSANAVTLASNIQLISRFMGTPEQVFETFDYEHCKVCWEPSLLNPVGGKITYYGQSQQALAEKLLLYQPKSRFVLSAFKRIEKFVKRGYSLPISTLLNLKESFEALDLSDPDVLERELSSYYGLDAEIAERIRNYASEGGVINLETLKKISEDL